MNTNVNFEIAKLLKEKGFDVENKDKYKMFGSQTIPQLEWYNDTKFNIYKDYYLAPTIAEVVMWLYEKHGIWVQGPFPLKNGKWEWVVFFLKEPLEGSDGFKNRMSIVDKTPYYDTPTETYLAAIEYTLKNLIK